MSLAIVGIQSSTWRESGVLVVGVLMQCLQNQEKKRGRYKNRSLKGMSFGVVATDFLSLVGWGFLLKGNLLLTFIF